MPRISPAESGCSTSISSTTGWGTSLWMNWKQKKRRDRSHAKSYPFRELLQILFYGNSALGNSLLYISFLSVAFGRVRPGGRTLFLFYTLIEKNFVSYCKSLYIFSYCSIQTFAASIPQSSRFMDRALIHPKKFMKVI